MGRWLDLSQNAGWLFPYVRSRVYPGEIHPITSYLFLEYKCNLDCWYCWAFDNRAKGMTEDVARRSIDWLHDNGCRVLALMGGEPVLRPDLVHKVVYYAAKKGFWVYLATSGRLLRPEVADCVGLPSRTRPEFFEHYEHLGNTDHVGRSCQ